MIKTDKVTIREAKNKDIFSILDLVTEFHMEGLGRCALSFKADTIHKTIVNFIERHIVIVSVVGDVVVGLIAGMILPSIFDEEQLIATEVIWFVNKEYRQSSVGVRLLKEFEQVAKDNGASIVCMVNLAEVNGERMKKYYNKIGYKELEVHYLKEV